MEDILFLGAPDPAECLALDDVEPDPPATDGIVSPADSANCSSVSDCARDALSICSSGSPRALASSLTF